MKCLVISPETEMVYVSSYRPLTKSYEGFWVSKNHPLSNDGNWGHAVKFATGTETKILQCYNLVLESRHVLFISGFAAVTLGHGIKGDIVEHDYYGTNKVVDDLSKMSGWEDGIVEIKDIVRNDSGTVCGLVE